MKCARCHKRLSNPQSLTHGLGPVCYAKSIKDFEQRTSGQQLVDIPFEGDIVCRRDADNILHFNIAQLECAHSPTGMEWGYGGSGPADFALNILLHFTDPLTARTLHQDFKFKFVAAIPREGGEIKGEEIRRWLEFKAVEKKVSAL
jgi:hypothetical protein